MRSSMRLAITVPGPRASAARPIAEGGKSRSRLGELASTVRLWNCRRRERQALLALADTDALSDHLLRDLGLTRAEVRAEGRKPFWHE